MSSVNPRTFYSHHEYPPKADLSKDVAKPLPKVVPGTIDPASMTGDAPNVRAKAVVDAFNSALASKDVEKLASCFYADQAYWRDIVAFTSHLRTLFMPRVVATALLQLVEQRQLDGNVEVAGAVHFAVMSPVMMFIDCGIKFKTASPALECMGKMVLLPVKLEDGTVDWKIWVLSTWVEQLIQHPEDESLLLEPSQKLDDLDTIETDVLIVGAGTSGLITAARLKALGSTSVVIDRNAQIGDSWAHRYDSLKFHVPTSNCELPYVSFGKELQSPHRLSRDEVVHHLQEYATKFHLNVILSTTIHSSTYSQSAKKWTVKIKTAGSDNIRTVVSQHFVQATGLGSGKPFLPFMENKNIYTGLSIHSTKYQNTKALKDQGVKSVAVIGSANTAFDVMRDCHDAGLKTTIVARSPTYIFPYDYVMDPHGIGAYDALPLDAADRMLNTFPSGLDGQFSHGLFAHLASSQPDRYSALAQAGFPVLDSRDPTVNVQHNLLERGGGHYIDVGGTDLIAEGKVTVRGLVEPIGYTDIGLRLSDGSELEADAVIWCTGYADKNVKNTAKGMLGADQHEHKDNEDVLGPSDIAARLDASWGVDAEGEVRGVWKRHLRMENFWVIGGVIQHQRWWSRPMVQQIRLALDGELPPAYRDTPFSE